MKLKLNLKCIECGTDGNLSVEIRKDRSVNFRVDCHECGCFSHYLENAALSAAVAVLVPKRPKRSSQPYYRMGKQ